MSQRTSLPTTDPVAQEDFITDLSYLLKLPYGISYSCYWGFSTVLINDDPYIDGLTQDEELELIITLSNDIFTNLFFNAGYIF